MDAEGGNLMEQQKTGVIEYVDHQIHRVDGKNVFVEVMSSAFAIGKVQMNFIEYDPAKGNKQVKNIQVYMDIPKFLVFANDILSGRIPEMGAREKAKAKAASAGGQTAYPGPIYQDLGGVTSQRLKVQKRKYSFEIPEGYAISRIFYLTPGLKADWMISGQLGLGKENDKGLIVPQGKPKEIVRIPMDNDALKAFVLVAKAHLEAYYASIHVHEAMKEELQKQLGALISSLKK